MGVNPDSDADSPRDDWGALGDAERKIITISFGALSDAEHPDLDFDADLPPLSSASEPAEAQPAPVQKPLKEAEERIELGTAESVVARARVLSDRVFKEAKRLPPYKAQLATRERLVEFQERVMEVAILENKKLRKPLEAPQVREVAARVCGAVARYEHSSQLQRMRQALQVAARHRGNRGRDLQIVRMRENGLSLRAISENLKVSVGAIRKVLDREQRQQRRGDNTNDTAV